MMPEIVLGPPGTGKTTTLLNMVDEELSKGTPPQKIGYLSFTKKAANEAVNRACQKFSLNKRDFRYFRTIHSLCYHELGLSDGDVMDGRRQMEFGDYIGIKVSPYKSMDDPNMFGFEIGDRILFMINLARVRCIPLRQQFNEFDDGLQWSQVEYVERGLQEFKTKNHLVDYTDMLEKFVQSDWCPKLDVLFVDESQDLALLQWHVITKLAQHTRRLVIAGDDDQAIYRWAGAAVDHFIDMEGQVQILNKSWRVPPEIQSLSANVINKVKKRRQKEWAPMDKEGFVDRSVHLEHVDWSDKNILVLVRNAFLMKSVEELLHANGIIYRRRGHSSVRPSVLEGILAWEDLRKGKDVSLDQAEKVYGLMSSGSRVKRGFKSLPGFQPNAPIRLNDLKERGGLLVDTIWHEALDRIPAEERAYLLRALQKGESLLKKPRVEISTVHGAKGGEADHVILLTDMASRTYDEYWKNPDDEARVWYVAVTRAMRKLTLVSPQSTTSFRI